MAIDKQISNLSAAAAILALVFVAGCTDEKVSKAEARDQIRDEPEAESGYSIDALVTIDGAEQVVRFGPSGFMPDFKQSNKPTEFEELLESAFGEIEGSIRELAVVEGENLGFSDTTEEDLAQGFATGTTLTHLAAKTCSRGSANMESGRPTVYINYLPFSTLPISLTNHITRTTVSCDAFLAAQEVLLCTADRLAEIADSPGTVQWDSVYEDDSSGPQIIKVTIPPQATEDRFIARDMALNVLAGVAQASLRDFEVALPLVADASCTMDYFDFAEDPDDDSELISQLFDPHFRVDGEDATDASAAEVLDSEGDLLPDDEIKELMYGRIALRANILAGAARLAKKLVEDSVHADLAGAERARSAAGDPAEGARRMWGAADPNAEGPPEYYNTMRHALRVLFGRLEINEPSYADQLGPWHPQNALYYDPECAGWHAGELLDALGGAQTARWNDIPPNSASQASALNLLERSGIVVPPVDGRIAIDRQTLIEQLLRIAAAAAGETLAAFDTSDNKMALAIRQALASDELSDADVEFALNRNFDAFRLLTNYPEVGDGSILEDLPLGDAAVDNGLLLGTAVAGITAAAGIVVDNGIPREELTGNIMPRLSAAVTSSQCAMEREADGDITASSVEEILSPNRGWVDSHQNPFALAEVFRRQLALISDKLSGHADNGVGAFANTAAAEIKQWAGGRVIWQPGKMAVTAESASIEDIDRLYITGITYAELGVSSPEELREVLVRVDARNPVHTECLVGQREACPAIPSDSDPLIFQAPLSVVEYTASGTHSLGLHGPVIEVTFPHITTFYDPDISPPHEMSLEDLVALLVSGEMPTTLNIVVRADKTINAGVGRFLTSVQLAQFSSGKFMSAVVSPLQTALANQVFGLGQVDRSHSSCRSGYGSALATNYCDLGISRNQFIPLANELTSEGTGFEDSWRHYLRVAKEAAAKADELGRELIDLGIQRDIRQEAALEEVANLCGSFPTIDGVDAEEGIVEPDAEDGETSACMDDSTIDLVFLGEDPFAFGTGEDEIRAADKAIRGLYCPSQWVALGLVEPEDAPNLNVFRDSAFCKAKPRGMCAADTSYCLTHAGLGFTDRAVLPERGSPSEVCGDLLRAKSWSEVTGTIHDPTALMTAVSGKAWSTHAGLKAAVQSYRLVETVNGEWAVYLDDQPVVASLGMVSAGVHTIPDIYPACMQQDGFSSCTEVARAAARLILRTENLGGAPAIATLRAYAEDAIHGLAALAGQMPGDAITMPMPVVDFNTLPPEASLSGDGAFVPAWTVYGPSMFTEQSGASEGVFELDPTFLGANNLGLTGDNGLRLDQYDISSLRGLVPITDEYLDERDDAGLYGPALAQDFADIAEHPEGYLLLLASNPTFTYQEDIGNPTGVVALQELGAALPGITRQDMNNWYVLFARDFSRDDSTEPYGSSKAAGIQRIAPLFHGQPTQQSGPDESQGGVCPQEFGGPAFVLSFGKDDASGTKIAALGQYLPRVDLVGGVNGFVPFDLAVDGEPPPIEYGWEPYHSVLRNFPFPMSPATDGGLIKDRARSYYFDKIEDQYAVATAEEFYDLGPGVFQQLGFSRSAFNTNRGEYASNGFGGTDYSTSADGELLTIHPEGYYRLSPKKCGAHQRIELMMPAPSVDTVLRGLGMACYASVGGLTPGIYAPPTSIQRVEDIRHLESWMAMVAQASNTIGSMLVLNDVPRSVVDAIRENVVDHTAVGQGVSGDLKLELAEHLRIVRSAFVDLAIHFDKLRGEMRAARVRIEGTAIEHRAARLANERDSLELQRQRMVDSTERAMREMERDYGRLAATVTMAAASLEAAGGALRASATFGIKSEGIFNNLATAVNAGLEIAMLTQQGVFDRRIGRYNDDFFSKVSGIIAAEEQVDEDRAANELQAALTDLSLDVLDTYSGVNNSVTAIQNGTSDALQIINQLMLTRQSAATALAKAAGADFVTQNGDLVPLHLNTVYRRQFGVLKERYERAHKSALRAAYVARLAIEQRLGVRFDNVDENVGPLPPPSTWVNDLCSLEGIDYSELRDAGSEPSNDPEQEVDLIAGFADEYIGDYVGKLEELVEFYNVQSPFKESDDTAILSLRELLGKTGNSCSALSRNLLFYSDHLEAPAQAATNHVALRGWRVSGCDAEQCLRVDPGVMLANGEGENVEAPEGGAATWLHSVSPDATLAVGIATSTEYGAPANTVYQSVRLQKGERYTLTWWDMLRAADGTPSDAAAAPYRVAVYSDQWEPVATFTELPYPSDDGVDWSERHRLEFIAFETGDFHVAFTPALPGGEAQSIAIANVQLERQSAGFEQVGYQSNAGSLMVASGDCGAEDPAAFRGRFEYECEDETCYYALNDLLTIDTELLNQGRSPLIGQIALGNFNYRHVALAANIVGTGVLDCSDSQLTSCYGSGFVEYDLIHRAHDVPLLDYDGDATCFDFRSAGIRSGKALSTERFLTLPLSSADRELVTQEALQQSQFAGRPLSGSYRLRIRDTPALAWENVEDVQLLVDYRYWSRVE